MRSEARTFFEDYVARSYDEFRAAPHEEYRAKIAVEQANIMAERMWHAHKDKTPHRIYNSRTPGDYRTALEDVCVDFGLLRDIAEAHKHMSLGRANRRVTRNTQTGTGTLGYGEGGFGEGEYGGGEQLVVTLDDGSKRAVSAILKNVVEMWDGLTAT